MKNSLDPKDFNFHESSNYPEIHDFFGPNTFIKTIADMNNGKDHFYWYQAIKVPSDNSLNDERYTIYSGVFTKGKSMTKSEWPRTVYLGLISGKEFARDLLCNLLGTLSSASVAKEGMERKDMYCLYKSHK